MAYSKRGYLALKKESALGTAVKPDVYVEILSETLTETSPLIESSPVYGSRSKKLHMNRMPNEPITGDVAFEIEPNTIGYFLSGAYGLPSTAGPADTTAYTHTFTQPYTTAALPSFTIDIAIGDDDSIRRYFGAKIHALSFSQQSNVWVCTATIMAKAAYIVDRFRVASTSTDTALEVYQTSGLTATDTLNLGVGAGATEEEKAVTAITDEDTVAVVATGQNHAIGDLITIKRSSPSFSQLSKLIWIGSQKAGSTFKVGAAIGTVASDCAQEFSYTITNDVEARNCADGINNINRYPTTILDKGYESSGSFMRYWEDLVEQDKFNFNTLRAIEVEVTGDLAGATTTYSSFKLQLPEVYWTNAPTGRLGNDDIIDEAIEFVSAYNATAAYESKITLVNKIASYA